MIGAGKKSGGERQKKLANSNLPSEDMDSAMSTERGGKEGVEKKGVISGGRTIQPSHSDAV